MSVTIKVLQETESEKHKERNSGGREEERGRGRKSFQGTGSQNCGAGRYNISSASGKLATNTVVHTQDSSSLGS